MSLADRLAKEIVRRNLPDIPGADLTVSDEMLPVLYSGLYQPIHGAIRAALDEAAKVAREWEARGLTCVPGYEIDEWPDAEKIAAAIEAL